MFASICRTIKRAVESGLQLLVRGAIGPGLARGRPVILAPETHRIDQRMDGLRVTRATFLLGTALLAVTTTPAVAADQAVCTRTSHLLGENLTFTRKDIVQYADVQDGTPAGTGEATEGEPQIEFTADMLEYDSNADVVTATGNVLLVREDQSLVADSVTWDRKSGQVRANGEVQIIDAEGNKLYGDSIELTESIRDGVIENILVVLDAGGRMVATRGTRTDGVITLENAAYSACLVETPTGKPKRPSWQLRAIKVVYNPADKRVRYDGARLELFGLPVIPMPGLSHPVGEGSGGGLLVPDIRFSQANGVQLSVPYYFNLAPDRDLTVTGSVFTGALPMAAAQYRALTDRGGYQITGYATASSRIPVGAGGLNANSQNDFRGYFDATGRFQVDEAWSISGSVRATTDRTFLRRYDISRDDRLRSTFDLERIGPNSYFSLAGWATQTLRVNDPQGQVPIALPVIDWRLRLPDQVAGGKVEFQVNTLAIGRTAGQDTQRAFAQARWDLRRLTSLGQEFTLTALARGDVYNSSDNALTNTLIYRGNSGIQARASGSVAADLRWPFVGEAFGGTQVLSPRVQVVATPTTGNLEVPNEDSRAIELEDSNLFALNRLPGYDRMEEGVRVVYGVEWSLQRPGMQVNAVVGQSYRFDDERDFLPEGTGLGNRTSDVVGRFDLKLRNFIRYTHRFRLDKDNLAVRRNEVDITIGGRQTYAQVGYLRLNRDIGPEVEDLQDREELRVAGRVRVARYWSVFGAAVVDLSNAEEDPRLQSDGFEPIRTRLGVAYEDDCLELGVTWRRDYIPVGDAQRGDTFLLRVALRNLGF